MTTLDRPKNSGSADAASDVVAKRLGPVVVRPRWATLTNVERLSVALPIALVVGLGFSHRWTYDDAFVYFRTVDQIMAGHGPVFNVGERVEAFASPLWLAALTVGEVVGPSRLEYTAACLSLLFTAAGLLLAALASIRMTDITDRPRRGVRLPFGLTAFAVLWPVWIWSTGGMETGLTLCWLGACFYILSQWAVPAAAADSDARRSMPHWHLVVLGLGWLVRPEMSASSALFVLVVIFGSPATTRQRVRTLTIAAAVPVAYQLFRMGYYGLVLSSSSIAREDSLPRPGFGWDFFTDFVSPYYVAVPVVAFGIGIYAPFARLAVALGEQRRLVVVSAIATSGVANAVLVVVVVGGDGVHARLLLPALFAMLAPAFVVPLERRYAEAIAVTIVWAACCGPLLRPPADNVGRMFSNAYPGGGLTYEDAGFETRGAQPWIDGGGFYLAGAFSQSGYRVPFDLVDRDRIVVASEGVGLLGYVLGPDIHVLDMHGGADPLTAHQRLASRAIPGREKLAFAPWIIARFAAEPSTAEASQLAIDSPYGGSTPEFDYLAEVQWAGAAMACAPIAQLIDSYERRLSAGQFFANIWHAMSNTSLRIDASPSEAYDDEGCWPEQPGDVEELPADVAAFYDRVAVSETLPRNAERGDLSIAGRCSAIYAATGDELDPWRPIGARRYSAIITFDPDDPPLFAAVFVIGPFGSDSAVVWLTTDGAGNYRITQELNWFPTAGTEWTPIPVDPVEVSIVADISDRVWRTAVDEVELTDVPMSAQVPANPDDKAIVGHSPDTDVVAALPRPAVAGSDTSEIEHRSSLPSANCVDALNAHPFPSRGGGVRIDRFTAVID